MSIRTQVLRSALAAGLVLEAAIATLGARQATMAAKGPLLGGHAGPIGLSMYRGAEALVLQSDGYVFTLDTTRGAIGAPFYRVPAAYQAVDLAAGTHASGSVVCFTVNKSSSKDYGSFVLQILPDRREVWSWLGVGGVYVGIALDAAAGQAYVGNSTNNGIFRVAIGESRAQAQRVAVVSAAERIGAMAIDPVRRRLFVSDMGTDVLFVVSAIGESKPKSILLDGISEVRALAWSPQANRVYLADAADEAIWAVDPDAVAPKPQLVFNDRPMREPSGLAVAGDGTLWVADELARAVFQLSVTNRAILRTVRWEPRLAK